jgi:hypothetical protein
MIDALSNLLERLLARGEKLDRDNLALVRFATPMAVRQRLPQVEKIVYGGTLHVRTLLLPCPIARIGRLCY